MDNELREEIETLKAEIAALKDDRLPRVDRASKRRDNRQILAGFGLFAVALLVAATMSASALSGSNTVLSDDIKDTEVHGSDINSNAVTGAKVKDGALTGVDVANNALSGSKLNGGSMFYVAKTDLVTVASHTASNHKTYCEPGDLAVAGGFANSASVWTFTPPPRFMWNRPNHSRPGTSSTFNTKTQRQHPGAFTCGLSASTKSRRSITFHSDGA